MQTIIVKVNGVNNSKKYDIREYFRASAFYGMKVRWLETTNTSYEFEIPEGKSKNQIKEIVREAFKKKYGSPKLVFGQDNY